MLGVIIGIISLFLPWGSAFIRSSELSGVVIAQVALNIFDLFASNNLTIVFGASLFTAGLLLSILNRWFVIAQIAGIIVLSFTMGPFAISKLPIIANPLEGLRSDTGLGMGFLIGCFSILILCTLLVEERWKDDLKKGEKQNPPSELVNSELWGQAGFQRKKPGSRP